MSSNTNDQQHHSGKIVFSYPDHDPYAILGVQPHDSEATVARAYRKLALQWHPDKLATTASAAEQTKAAARFQDLQRAKAFLLEAEYRTAREEYDKQRASALLRQQVDAARDKGLSERRKRMRDELHRHEQAAVQQQTQTGVKSASKSSSATKTAKVDALRRQGAAMREAYAAAQQEQEEQQQQQAATAKSASKAREKDQVEDRQVRLKWSRKKMTTSPSEHSLATLLAPYGVVERVEWLGSKGNAALITFADASSCRPCVDAYATSEVMRAHYVGARKEREDEEAAEAEREERRQKQREREERAESRPVSRNTEDAKLRRAAERERVLRELEEQEEQREQQSGPEERIKDTDLRRKKPRNTHSAYPFPPPFPTAEEDKDQNLTPLQRLERAEAVVLKDLLPLEMVQKIRLAS